MGRAPSLAPPRHAVMHIEAAIDADIMRQHVGQRDIDNSSGCRRGSGQSRHQARRRQMRARLAFEHAGRKGQRSPTLISECPSHACFGLRVDCRSGHIRQRTGQAEHAGHAEYGIDIVGGDLSERATHECLEARGIVGNHQIGCGNHISGDVRHCDLLAVRIESQRHRDRVGSVGASLCVADAEHLSTHLLQQPSTIGTGDPAADLDHAQRRSVRRVHYAASATAAPSCSMASIAA